MESDAARRVDTQAWLSKARLDLRGAAIDLAAEPPLTGDALFHAQQACEKALKAFLAWHDEPFGKTHDLAVLGAQCARIDPRLTGMLSEVAVLTQYAWRFRYPGDAAEPSRSESDRGVRLAERVVATVRERLGLEVASDVSGR